jgi:ABC-type Zn uptake system ZnuABC Zn-binding protein ZnuA
MTILNKFTIAFALIILSFTAYGKPKIVTSTSTLASIVLMLTGDAVEVVTIDTEGSCPHHYHARPSDRLKFQDAALAVYIDDNFEGYMPGMLKNYSGIKVKVSDISKVKIQNLNGETNWHFWLDLGNVLALQIVLAEKIKDIYPELDDVISENLARSREKLFELSLLKRAELQDLDELVLLSDSMEYFFSDLNVKLIKLYQNENFSLKYLSDLEENIKEQSRQCLVIDESQDPNSYQRFNKKIIQLDSENWATNDEIKNDGSLFFVKYLEIINKLKGCQP